MPSELSYTERDTDLDFSGAFSTFVMDSDLCPSVAAGLVATEFYCAAMYMPNPSDFEITFEVEAILSPATIGDTFSSGQHWNPPSARLSESPISDLIYLTLADPGDYTFRLRVLTFNEAGSIFLCEPPMLPAWFRVIGDVFEPVPPSTEGYSIRATVGL